MFQKEKKKNVSLTKAVIMSKHPFFGRVATKLKAKIYKE
jgi:hypothetical protein